MYRYSIGYYKEGHKGYKTGHVEAANADAAMKKAKATFGFIHVTRVKRLKD